MSGALTHPPSKVLRQALVDAGAGTLPADEGSWPISASQERNKPDAVITVFDTASRLDGRTMPDGVMQEHYGIQVKVRDSDFQQAYTKASEIQDILDSTFNYTGVTVDSSAYVLEAVTRTGGILSLGKEPGSKRNMMTINAVAAIRQTT